MDINEDLTAWPDARLCSEIEQTRMGGPIATALVAELLRRFNEQGLALVAKPTELKFVVDGQQALKEIAKVASKLQEGVDVIRREVLEEVIQDLDAKRKGGFWANGDARGNHVRDQSFIRAIGAVKELKAKGE